MELYLKQINLYYNEMLLKNLDIFKTSSKIIFNYMRYI